MATEPTGALRELSTLLKRLILHAGTNNTKIAERTGFPRQQVSRAVNGRGVPSPDLTAALVVVLGAGEQIAQLRERADLERKAQAIGAVLPASNSTVPPKAGRHLLPALTVGTETMVTEVSPADRRQTFRTAGALALGALADDVAQRITTADPDPGNLDDAEAAVRDFAVNYRTTPHAAKLAALAPAWHATETALDRRVSLTVRTRLTQVVGWQAFYLGLTSFDLGDDRTARKMLRLAQRHASEAADLLPLHSGRRSDVLLLQGSIAAIQSSVAYFTGAYGEAADIAAQARDGAHPFTRPILAGCQARAAAIARPDDVAQALADMQDHVWDGPLLPGPNPGNAAFAHTFLAISLAHTGRGDQAEGYARTGLALEQASGPDHFVQIAGKYNALALAHLRRPRPEPEGAVEAIQHALTVLDGRPTRDVIQRAGEMWRQMDTQWSHVPAVHELGEQIRSSRLALETGQPPTETV
ncbi:helix-turn-helix transcriptional regulator [Frankia sp. R82]|uniref:helix-turn-helix domain-containing protein n=1 Tax=Frankia sp. R82 TaxID=2950553 RepID=UPI0020436647|nr:helix-turn-helix transcriptional regulator [Frankia sp. R82]MCM3884310.1 helix-turn-helix domain-containing protein [Frankia sp. R82]